MEHEGLVTTAKGKIKLAQRGRSLAEQVVRRHRLAERFLTDILGLSWADAHQEAGRWEHVISDSVEAAMNRILGDPTTCPHGNPIPGSHYVAPDRSACQACGSASGSRSAASRRSSSSRLACSTSSRPSAITPGRTGVVTAASPDGTVTVEIAGHHVGVGVLRQHAHPRHGLARAGAPARARRWRTGRFCRRAGPPAADAGRAWSSWPSCCRRAVAA